MAKRSLDMLPLLDVFMVVLFVFATIQEGQLDSSTKELEAAKQQLLDAQLQESTQSAQAAALALELELQSQQLRAANIEVAEQTATISQYVRACGPRSDDGPICPAAQPEARELVEVATVHEQMLANVAVFEIEVGGQIVGERIVDRCCVRANPPKGEWKPCGVVPDTPVARGDWFDEGGDGLREMLRETRDGYAIVLVQQDGRASYQIGQDLANLLHERLREHYVYDNGVSELDCPLLGPLAPP